MNAIPGFLKETYSTHAQSYFLRLVEDLGQAIEPTPSQLQVLERSYSSTGEFLVNCVEFQNQLDEIHPQGSRQLGTMVRPLREKDGFDVDLVALFKPVALATYSGPNGAIKLIDQLHATIGRYADRHGLKLRRWERCVTLEYAGGMCADIAPVIAQPHLTALHGELHGVIPDRKLRSFHPTNPRGFIKLFNKIAAIRPAFQSNYVFDSLDAEVRKAEIAPLADTEVFDRILCRLIQLMKLHRDISFSSEALAAIAPSSIFITALAANSYRVQAPILHRNQLELLLDIIKSLPFQIEKRSIGNGLHEWIVDNPTAPGDNLASAMQNIETQQAFTQWHRKLLEDVMALIDCIDQRQGLDRVAHLVTSSFGQLAGDLNRRQNTSRQSSARVAGKAMTVTASGITVPMTGKNHTFFGS
jgi:hypothetical protein